VDYGYWIGEHRFEDYTLYSFADGPGIANINPLTDAAVANAAGVDDPAQVYDNPDAATLQKVRDNIPGSVSTLQAKLRPLLMRYNAESDDPIKVKFKTDHSHLDGLAH
jgi:hypothetical protein